jgi:hypothetical protein
VLDHVAHALILHDRTPLCIHRSSRRQKLLLRVEELIGGYLALRLLNQCVLTAYQCEGHGDGKNPAKKKSTKIWGGGHNGKYG